MNYARYARTGARNGLAAIAYIALVAWLLTNVAPKFGDDAPQIIGALTALSLFVVSALITGSLVLWQPAKLLLDGKKAEAGALLGFTGGTMFAILIALGAYLLIR